MVKVRLQRVGAKNKAQYRIVIADQLVKRDGKAIEVIGTYDPTIDPPRIEIKKERLKHWINVGAQPTNSVSHLIKRYERSSRVSN